MRVIMRTETEFPMLIAPYPLSSNKTRCGFTRIVKREPERFTFRSWRPGFCMAAKAALTLTEAGCEHRLVDRRLHAILLCQRSVGWAWGT